MAVTSKRRILTYNVKKLHLNIPYHSCTRSTTINTEYDPGIGEMIVNPDSTAAYFRVRPPVTTGIIKIFNNIFNDIFG